MDVYQWISDPVVTVQADGSSANYLIWQMQPGSSIHQAISAGSDSLPFPIHFSWQMIIADSVTQSADWVMRCWRGYLSGTRCKWFVCGPTDATATRSSLAALKSRLVQPSWCRLTQVVLDMRPLTLWVPVAIYLPVKHRGHLRPTGNVSATFLLHLHSPEVSTYFEW